MNDDDRSIRVRETLERRERQRKEFERVGWREILDGQEFERLSKRFCDTFYDGNAIALPGPFITWDVRHAEKNASDLQRFADDLHSKCIVALKSVDHNGHWYVLENVNHPWYRLELSEMPNSFRKWPVLLLPNADPCYLVADDFNCGIIAETDRTISVFGKQLLAAITNQKALVLTDIKGRSEE